MTDHLNEKFLGTVRSTHALFGTRDGKCLICRLCLRPFSFQIAAYFFFCCLINIKISYKTVIKFNIA